MTDHNEFQGKIGRTFRDSQPWWPPLPTAPQDRPNVLIILFDDLGFAHLNCYGSTIDTPNINRLAANGLRFTNFHVTPLCSPTRASLLTGRNHHTVGMRSISHLNSGYPHMRGAISRNAATIAEMLSDENYATFALGKWHLAPMEETSQAGPFHEWPLQRGFDRYYGFLGGETDQFYPELAYDNHLVAPPKSPEDGYHLTEDLADHAIGFLRDHQSIYPGQPSFLYFAPGATHAPHQAPQAYLDKYRGRFDAGWDEVRQQVYARQQELGVIPDGTELAPRNPGVEAWDDMSENAQRFAIALQEAFAAFLDHTDAQIGRLIDYLETSDQLDNTIVLLMADNGASQEGGAGGQADEARFFMGRPEDPDEMQSHLAEIGGLRSSPNYPWGWAQVGNTPLRWYKQNTHGGGVRVPLIAHWPDGIAERGGFRRQFHHVSDVLPTVLETLGVEAPDTYHGIEQIPVTGSSFAYAFDAPDAPTPKEAQYFEMFGHRGIWLDGWKAVTRHIRPNDWTDDEWELFHLDEDFSEMHDLAQSEPEKLRELVERWWVEAGRHGVLPLDDRIFELAQPLQLPGGPHTGFRYRYTPPITHIPPEVSPVLDMGSWTAEAAISRGSDGGDGVIFARGAIHSGLSLFIQDNSLQFDYHAMYTRTHIRTDAPIPTGDCTVGIAFESDEPFGPGRVTLSIDGQTVGTGVVPVALRSFLIGHTMMDIGADERSPVSDSYDAPFPFQGAINSLEIEVTPYQGQAASRVAEQRRRQALARQ